MSNSIEYCQSTTSKPYESALTPEGLTSEEYKLLTKKCAATEEKYVEAIRNAVEKKKNDLKKKEKENKKLRKEQKKAEKAVESGKGKTAVKVTEMALVNEKKKTNADTERERSEGSKETLKKFMVEESNGEGRPGLSKRVKAEVSGPTENEEEFEGNRNSSAFTVSSKEVSELLQKLADTVGTLANKIDILTGQVIDLWSCMDDLVDNFQLEDINSPEEFISDIEEW
ncbi:hypothetical protein ARMSODRAFT_970070 [Armillaria solidipes]|uniref:Uncharacterized protein n=1 Tax=Armillaria solidipes TaxID=1076256 RepID=A0A2H3CAP6_9AGAR|nr:hypothetical protein ARMSODRAFT_970070 [Armillaria solidipes]